MALWKRLRWTSRWERHGSRTGTAWDENPPLSEERAARGQEGRFLRKLWQSSREQWRRMTVAGVLIWAGYTVLLSPGGTFHVMKLRNHAERVERAVARLEATEDSLQRVIEDIDEGDPAVTERIAREEFGFSRDNERIYVLPDDAEDRRRIDRSRHPTPDQKRVE